MLPQRLVEPMGPLLSCTHRPLVLSCTEHILEAEDDHASARVIRLDRQAISFNHGSPSVNAGFEFVNLTKLPTNRAPALVSEPICLETYTPVGSNASKLLLLPGASGACTGDDILTKRHRERAQNHEHKSNALERVSSRSRAAEQWQGSEA